MALVRCWGATCQPTIVHGSIGLVKTHGERFNRRNSFRMPNVHQGVRRSRIARTLMKHGGRPQYDADLIASAHLARRSIADQFPDLEAEDAIAFGEGWDNWIYRVGDWLFRFPRGRIAVPLMEREMAILPRLAPRLPRPIPQPVFFGVPSPRYPWPFFGYSAVQGAPVAVTPLDPGKRSASAGQLADFLQALQTVEASEASAWGAGEPTLGRLDIGRLKERFEVWLSAAVVRGIADADAAWVSEFRQAEAPPLSLDCPVLVHGDLNFKNVLLEPGGELAGVVDWGDLHLGHWAEDWMFAAGYFPPAGQEIFRTRIGAFDERLWRTARAVSIFVYLIVLVSASDMGHVKDVAEARWQLRNMAATRGS